MSDVVHLSSAAPSRASNDSSGESNFVSKSNGSGRPSTFIMPAYDPVPIAVIGGGILLVVALAFAY
jgi:hypothetical protein